MGIVHVYALYASGFGPQPVEPFPLGIGLILIGLLSLPAILALTISVICERD